MTQSYPSNQDLRQIIQDQQQLDQVLESARQFIDRDYLHVLSSPRCRALDAPRLDPTSVRMFRLQRLVYNEEDIHTRLLSVYHAVGNLAECCFLLIRGSKANAELYLGLRDAKRAAVAGEGMRAALRGNFPGMRISDVDASEIPSLLSGMLRVNNAMPAIAAVSRVPARRDLQVAGTDSLDMQGIEHFIDAMKGQEYTALILASPLSREDIVRRRNSLESLASSLSVLQRIGYQYTQNMTATEQHSLNTSISHSISQSVSRGFSSGYSTNSGVSTGHATGMNTHFNAMGFNFGQHNAVFTSVGSQYGINASQQQGTQTTQQQGSSQTKGLSLGVSSGWTQNYENKAIQNLNRRIDEQLDRMRDCEAYGLWETCALFVSPQTGIAHVAASNYQSLVCGHKSGSEAAALNVWVNTGDQSITGQTQKVLESASRLRIPAFLLDGQHHCTAGTMVSGEELPILMNLPRRSVCGLPVTQMAAFGREIHRFSPLPAGSMGLGVGQAYHMGEDDGSVVQLTVQTLTAHTLVTGTTGVGKSTLITQILRPLSRVGVHFMVIEPVKGEYKYLLGGLPDTQVFTTDPQIGRMLHINPFEFPRGVHVLQHIDRLIELFSVCWALYAAQPALLRECVERAYLETGWDLSNSMYVRSGFVRYPTFAKVLEIVPKVIKESKFVGESKGTYEGALLSRLRMLTNGIYGQVFSSSAATMDSELFDMNAVVDLSGVGASDSIALIMGVLVIRMREYRSSNGRADNSPLKHIMVLEEAHHLLSRNQKQNVEGGESLSERSVQMITQCIAEMRSYGQGFFIADQSISQIDASAIRNTATKIVMQLPEAQDQQAAAESLSLSKEQGDQLAKLPPQVALIYQSGWIEPVLTHLFPITNEAPASVDIAAYREIRRFRALCVQRLLDMRDRETYDANELIALADGRRQLPVSKRRDYAALFRGFGDRYAAEPFGESQGRIIDFFGPLLTELMGCEDLFTLNPLPDVKENDPEHGRPAVFKANCGIWFSAVKETLDRYADGLTVDAKTNLVRLLLLMRRSENPCAIIHNTLFGKIGGRE